jgi:hypothetical protein
MRAPILLMVALSLVLPCSARAQGAAKTIPAGAKLFIAPMPDDFNQYLAAAITAKKVPVNVVSDKSTAEFEVTGHSETEKAGAAKKAIMLNWHSNEQASIQVANLQSGEVVFAYSANKKSSAHGKKSTAEACAKHLKEYIERGK